MADFAMSPATAKGHEPLDRGRAGLIGMLIFLASLTMLFVAALLGYVLIRLRAVDQVPLHRLTLPGGVWVSTLLMVSASLLLERAARAIRREQQARFRTALLMGGICILAFLAVQVPTLIELLARHREARALGVALHGLTFVLILLHAAHVVGGLIPFAGMLRAAGKSRYDHEHWWPVRVTALYWHFLDAVWLVMLAVLVGLG
jgi:cytochrome c oxidase subunit 3